jgi:hypothetical protein
VVLLSLTEFEAVSRGEGERLFDSLEEGGEDAARDGTFIDWIWVFAVVVSIIDCAVSTICLALISDGVGADFLLGGAALAVPVSTVTVPDEGGLPMSVDV